MLNYYSALGLTQGASKDEIRKAYRRLAMQYHPDKNPSSSAKQKFIEITEAYDALMSGKVFSFKKSFSRPASPKPKTHQEARKEKTHAYYEGLRKKFSDIRVYYNHPSRRKEKYRERYREINLLFILAGGIFGGGIIIPILLQQPGMLVFSFPLGLGLGVRLWWTGGRKKMRADMVFGKEEHYSLEELRDFFSTQTEIGNRDLTSNNGTGW